MTKRMTGTGARLAALALTSTAALALTACEEHAYPSAAPREGTAAPASDDAALAGAPTTRSPEYVPSGGPPPGSYPPPHAYGSPPDYAQGYGRSAAAGAPPVIISMAPIPNPPEEPRREGRRHHRHHRVYARMDAYGAPRFSNAPHAHHHRHRHGASPWVFHPYGAVHHHHHTLTAAPHPVAAPAKTTAAHPAAPQLPKPHAVQHHRHHHGSSPATAAAATGGSTNTTASNTSASNTATSGTEADHYQALQQGLASLFTNAAQLQAPAHMEVNQPVVVTLTLPATFAASAQAEAAKDGLSQAALSMNLIATLSGDGFTIVPNDPQSQPMARDTVTLFEWKVTPTSASRGQLQVSVKAQAAGDSHTLDLGQKSTRSGAAVGRIIGFGLLAVIALGLLGWAAQRRRPKVMSGSKPRATHTNGN